jgi:hypothetical protein
MVMKAAESMETAINVMNMTDMALLRRRAPSGPKFLTSSRGGAGA